MPRTSLPFCHCHPSRLGKLRYYVKLPSQTRGKGVRIKDPVYRSEGFMREYHAVVTGTPPLATPSVQGGISKGTLGWLIREFRKSRAWTHDIKQGTRKQRGPILRKLEEGATGTLPLEVIDRAKVEEGMKERTPNQARHFYETVRPLFKWAIEGNHFAGRNPTDGIKADNRNGKEDGHLPWPIEVIEQFERRWPVGTKERLVFDVFLYVGLRRGDAARLGKQHMPRGVINLKTEKTGMAIGVPVHPALAASIAACPSPGLAIIAKDDGMNYTKEGLGNFFREAIEKAGIPVTKRGSNIKGYSAHGIRKACATFAAESGFTEAELNAMFAWTGHQMAQLYTEAARRKLLAASGMRKWARPVAVVGDDGLEPVCLQLTRDQGSA